jgi:T5SS/PEP-CTERM-associated repeat protein
MRSKQLSIAAILGLAALSVSPARATEWLGSFNNDWNNGLNWFGFSGPGPADPVQFSKTNTGLIFRTTANVSSSTTVASMGVVGDADILGPYTLTRTNNAVLTVSGLTHLGFDSAAPLSTTTFNGLSLNTGFLTLNGAATGVLTGSGVITSAGVVELFNSSRFTVNSGTLNAANGINLGGSSVLQIDSGGTLNMNTGTTMNLNGATSKLQVNGGFAFSPGTEINTAPGADIVGTSYIDIGNGGATTVNLTGSGTTLTAAGSTVSDWGAGASGSGVVNLSNSAIASVQRLNIAAGTGQASINVDSNSQLNIGQTLTMGGGVSGRFIGMSINGGTVDVTGVATYNAFADTNLVSGTLKFRSSATINSQARLDITGGTLDTTNQTLTINGGTLTRTTSGSLSSGSSLRVQAGGTATLSNFFDIGNGNTAALTVTGAGSTYTSSSGLSDWGRGASGGAVVSIDSNAIATLSGGLRIGTNNGSASVTVASGGQLKPNTLEVGGGSTARTVNLTINGGTVSVNDVNATTTFNDKAVLNLQSGTFDPKGPVTFFAGSTANWSGGTFLVGNGKTLTVQGGTINRTNTAASGLSPGATLAINSAGKFESVGSYSVGEFGAGTVTLSGTNSRLWAKSDLTIGGASAGQVGTLTTTAGGGFIVGDNAAGFNNDVISIADNDPIASNAGGKLSILNGSVVTHTGDVVLASFGGTSGRLVVNGAGSLFKMNGGFFASEGIAQMNIEAGGKVEMNFASFASVPAGQSTTTVTGTNSILSSLGGLNVGTSGQATLNINSAGRVTAVNATLGSNAGSVGTLNMNDTDSRLSVTGDLVVGDSGTGVVNHNAGALIHIGDNPSLTGGRVDIGDSNLDGNSGGNLRLANNSTFTTAANFLVGEGANRFGRIAVGSGSTVTTTDKYFVGSAGVGRIEVTTGGKVNGLDMSLGDQSGGNGTLAVSGSNSQVNLTRDVVIGSSSATGTGAVTIDGAGSRLLAGNNLVLRRGTITTTNGGTVIVGDNALGFNSDRLVIGDNNSLGANQGGKLTITGGSTLNHHFRVLVGGLSDTSGEVIVTGADSKFIVGERLFVGNSGQGHVTISDGGVVSVDSYQYNPSTNSKLILNAGGTFLVNVTNANAALTSARSDIQLGYANGAWTGNGITSITAQTDSRLGIGYLEDTGLTIKLTLKGDTNLSGTVDFDDLLVLAQNYNGTNRFWQNGDFNYDGNVNFDDLLSLAQFYSQSLSVSEIGELGSNFASEWALAVSMVPEPVSGVLALAGFGLVRRRR